MSDNTQLSPAVAPGDVIRTLDKTGTGAPKTEVIGLDLGGGDGRPELIGSFPLPAALPDLPTDDDAAPQFSLSSATMDALEILFRQTIAASGYSVSAAELKAGIASINPGFPPGYVDRYITNVSGVTDTAPGFNAAFAAATAVGGQIRYGLTAPYYTFSPINFTQAAAPNIGAVTVQCEAPVLDDGLPMSLVAMHSGHVFDCAGTAGMTFRNVCISTGSTGNQVPKTAFYQARNNSVNPNGPSVGCSSFYDCNIIGYFTQGNYYNFGAEQDRVFGGYWINRYAGNSDVFVITASNIKAQTSTFVTVNTNNQSTRGHAFFDVQTQMQSSSAAADIFYFEQAQDTHIFASFGICAAGGSPGRAAIYVDMSVAYTDHVGIYGFQIDVGGGPQYGILFSNNAQTCSNWAIEGGQWTNTVNLLSAGASVVIDQFYIRDLIEPASHGLSIAGTLQNSTLDITNLVTLGTSSKNLLIVPKANLTVTTWANTVIIDKTTGTISNTMSDLANPTTGAYGIESNNYVTFAQDSTASGGCVQLMTLNNGATYVYQLGSAKGVVSASYSVNDCALAGPGHIVFAPGFSATPVLDCLTTLDMIGRGVAICKRATSVETRSSTTTLTNSTQLTYAIPGAGTYEFEVVVFSYFTTAVTDGITANVNYSGTFTAVGSYLCGSFTNGTTTDTGIQPVEISATVNNALAGLTLATYGASVSSATPAVHKIKGNLIATGTGTLAFAFAQSTSGVDTANLGVGSYMTVTQLS